MRVTTEVNIKIETTRAEARKFYSEHRPKDGTIGKQLDSALIVAIEKTEAQERA